MFLSIIKTFSSYRSCTFIVKFIEKICLLKSMLSFWYYFQWGLFFFYMFQLIFLLEKLFLNIILYSATLHYFLFFFWVIVVQLILLGISHGVILCANAVYSSLPVFVPFISFSSLSVSTYLCRTMLANTTRCESRCPCLMSLGFQH